MRGSWGSCCAVVVFFAGSQALAASGQESLRGPTCYQFETSDLRFGDLLTLRDGSRHVGKVMEWADRILLFGQDGRTSNFDADAVDTFQTRRTLRHLRRPARPDLTVGYVERLPRDPSWHGRVRSAGGLPQLMVDPNARPWRPKVGAPVTFRVHLLNAGGAASAATSCRVAIDDETVVTVDVPALAFGETHVFETKWSWRDGPHTLHVDIESAPASHEIVRWNNRFAEPIHGLGVTAIVARNRYEAFRGLRNTVDSFCFEDWLQYQLRNLNALMAASVYPSAPQGILERLRVDRILVVDDPEITPWPTDYAALLLFEPLRPGEELVDMATHVDWPALQTISRDLGLIDLTTTDTTLEQCLVRDANGMYVQRRHLFPRPRSMMYAAGGFPFSEQSAGFLNQTLGRPRGFRGDYLYQVPETVAVEVRANDGSALEGVEVEVFQLTAEGEYAGTIVGAGPSDPLCAATTDASGRAVLPNRDAPSNKTPGGYELRPNPFGKIAVDGSNGLLLLRLRQNGAEEYHFLRLFDCNVAYLRGAHREYVHKLWTRFGDPDALPAPPYTAVLPRETTTDDGPPRLYVTWLAAPGTPGEKLDEFRVYRRTSFGGNGAKPWSLHRVVRREGRRWVLQADVDCFQETHDDGPYSLDTFLAVSAVDTQGHESGLSPVAATVAYDKDAVKFAINSDHQAFITIAGPGPAQMLHYNGMVGTQPYGVRFRRFPGYRPGFGGIAIGSDRRLIITDPKNHILAFYDRGDLVDVVPKQSAWPGLPSPAEGRFNDPADVAVDDQGRLYVADRGNDRVQILGAGAAFAGLLDPDFHFDHPAALGFANGHLCVTDHDGTRLRVYDVSGETARFVRELPPLVDADRGLVDRSGRVYAGGRDVDGKWAILIYEPDGETAKFAEAIHKAEGEIGDINRPRGLYLFVHGEDQYGYFVNRLPFNVRRVKFK